MGNPAHITGFRSKTYVKYNKIIWKIKVYLCFVLLVGFLLYLLVLIAQTAPRRVQMQDAAIMQHETPTTPET